MREMENVADNDDALIHPAFRARISQIAAARQIQINQMTAAALSILANTAASLRRTSEAMAGFPEVAQIVSVVEATLTFASSSLQRWNYGEVPTSAEIEALVTCLQAASTGLSTARKLYAGGNLVPVVPNVSPNLVSRRPERRKDHSDARS
jgi:hypothetical protein